MGPAARGFEGCGAVWTRTPAVHPRLTQLGQTHVPLLVLVQLFRLLPWLMRLREHRWLRALWSLQRGLVERRQCLTQSPHALKGKRRKGRAGCEVCA